MAFTVTGLLFRQFFNFSEVFKLALAKGHILQNSNENECLLLRIET